MKVLNKETGTYYSRTFSDGTVQYRVKIVNEEGGIRDMLHNEKGPAYITPQGDCYYYLYGKSERKGGPCIVWANGKEECPHDNFCLKTIQRRTMKKWEEIKKAEVKEWWSKYSKNKSR